MVRAFSARRRGMKLVVLGKLEDGNAYHAEVRAAASDEVIFPGAIYDAGHRARAAASTPAPICTATPSAAPIPRWSRRYGRATP